MRERGKECNFKKKLPAFTVQLWLNDDWQEKGSAGREMDRRRHKTCKAVRVTFGGLLRQIQCGERENFSGK